MRKPSIIKVIPPSALTTPIMAFSRVRESVEDPPDELGFDTPDPGAPLLVMVVISNAGIMCFAKSEYGEGRSV